MATSAERHRAITAADKVHKARLLRPVAAFVKEPKPPRKGRGHPISVATKQLILSLYLSQKYSQHQIALELNLSDATISRVLDACDVVRNTIVAKAVLAEYIPKAADNVGKAINAGDTELSYRFTKDVGALPNAGPGGDKSPTVTINLGFLGAERAAVVFGTQPTSGPAGTPIDVDAEAHADKG